MEDTNLSASTHQLLTKRQWNSKECNEDRAIGLQSINSTFWNMLVFYFKGECFQFPVCATPFQVFSSHISLASLWKAVSIFWANSGQSASKQALSLQPMSPINNSHSPTVWETFFSRDWRLSGAQILLALQLLKLVANLRPYHHLTCTHPFLQLMCQDLPLYCHLFLFLWGNIEILSS